MEQKVIIRSNVLLIHLSGLLFHLRLFFDKYLLFSRKSDRKKEKSVVSLTHEKNIICSQTQSNDIAHEQTITGRQLFVGHVVGSRPMKRKKNLHRMIMYITLLTSKMCYRKLEGRLREWNPVFHP